MSHENVGGGWGGGAQNEPPPSCSGWFQVELQKTSQFVLPTAD